MVSFLKPEGDVKMPPRRDELMQRYLSTTHRFDGLSGGSSVSM